MKRLAIRWRLTLWYGVALLVVLIVFGGGCFWLMSEHLVERTDRELDEELAEVVREISLTSNEPQMLEHLQQRFGVHGMFEFQVATMLARSYFAASDWSKRASAGRYPNSTPGMLFTATSRRKHRQTCVWRVDTFVDRPGT